MKIALVLFDWFPHGGLQRDCARIGKCLLAAGATIDVICMSWQGPEAEGLHRILPALNGTGKVSKRAAFARFLATHLAQTQYAAVIGFNRLPGLDYYFAADTSFTWKAIRERNWFYRFAPRSRQYLAFEKAVFGPDSNTQILILSACQKEEYLTCFSQAGSRMIDIPPGIDRSRRAGEDAMALRASLRHELALADDEFLALQVGSGFQIKGVDRSLAAMASLPNAIKQKTRLLIIGRDDPGRFEVMARKLKIESCVTFIESRDDLPRYYQGADILLHPSYKESAGMVILEAVIAGLPVLTTETCGYAFHVEQANAGMVLKNPFSQQAMNTAFLDMLTGEKLGSWRENGIIYGDTQELYGMPEQVSNLVLSFVRKDSHAG